MKRFLVLLWALMIAAPIGRAAEAAFSFEALSHRAQDLAAEPYHARTRQLPDWLKKLTYDQYREIRFRPPESWWNQEKVPFKLQFFHPGFIYTGTVQIFEVNQGQPALIPFSTQLFDYGPIAVGALPPDFGFGGFRIHYFLNLPGDELGSFQGASYFRFLCRKAVYGLSARGIALNSGEAAVPEEFPDFEEFWIQHPSGPTANEIVVYALLNGPSVAGAYRFAIDPGADTVMHIKTELYFRKNPLTVGLAPLTSMYWHGKTSNFETDDTRPEVHDSDGLLMHNGAGEWLWRPLSNPAVSRSFSFSDLDPRGFGLMQRERRFEAYEDLEAASQLRPSAWVVPHGKWGKGSVRLVELHTPDETNDNIVAFWQPAAMPPPGQPVSLEYDLHWCMEQTPPVAEVVGTRYGHSTFWEKNLERFVVDFDGPELQSAGAETKMEPVITVGAGATLAHAGAEKNPYNGSWRALFTIKPDGSGHPVELRCNLKSGGRTLTETWTYLWQP
jgi:glucans biosynthesis protein